MTKGPDYGRTRYDQRTQTAMQALLDLGQSVWLDYLRRGMLRSGELQGLIDDGLRGMTSNPTIFEHAIGGSSDYDDELMALAASPASDREMFERLAVEDVRQAADLFRPVYDATDGRRTASCRSRSPPTLARDTEGTIAEARGSGRAVDRPNVMIKVPGTREGWPAIERLLTEGINVNVTLLFSLEHYRAGGGGVPAGARGSARAPGRPIDRLASVASFFVSRVDTETDRRIDAKGGALLDLRGQGRHRQRAAGLRLVSRTAGGATRWQAAGRRRAPGPSGSSGPAPAPRTPPTPTCSTWTRSSAPTPSTPCRPPPSGCSRTTGPCAPPCSRGRERRRASSWSGWPPAAWTSTTSPACSRTTASRSSPSRSRRCSA